MMRRPPTLWIALFWGTSAFCLVSFLVITQRNLTELAGYAFLGLVLGIVAAAIAAVVTLVGMIAWLGNKLEARRVPLSESAIFTQQTITAVALVCAVLFALRDVLIEAFTDGPGPNDLGEFLIGSALVGSLLVALGSGYSMGRDALAIGKPMQPQAVQPRIEQHGVPAPASSIATAAAAVFAAITLGALWYLFNS